MFLLLFLLVPLHLGIMPVHFFLISAVIGSVFSIRCSLVFSSVFFCQIVIFLSFGVSMNLCRHFCCSLFFYCQFISSWFVCCQLYCSKLLCCIDAVAVGSDVVIFLKSCSVVLLSV